MVDLDLEKDIQRIMREQNVSYDTAKYVANASKKLKQKIQEKRNG